MKKILLILAIIASIVCILAISVSGTVIYKDISENILFTGTDENSDRIFEDYEGAFPNTDEKGNALTWYIKGTETIDADTVHTVDSFFTIDETGTHASLSESGVYKYVNKEKELSIVSAYFPDNLNILTLSLSDSGYGSAYDFNTDKSNLLFLRLPNTLTVLPSRIGQGTPIIDCTIPDETPIKSFDVTSFHGSKNLRSVDIPASVTIIKSNGHSNNGNTFYSCVSLVDVHFSGNSQLETIQILAFNNCTSLKEITIPNSVINIEPRVFQSCTSLETVRLGANTGKGLTEYNVQSMLYQCSSLKYVYFSDTMVPTSGSHLFPDGVADMVFFYTGSYEKYEALKSILTSLGNNGKLTNATPIEWDSTKDDQYYKNLATTDKKCYVVYGYNSCNAFYNGIHTEKTEDQNPCWLIECAKCGVKNIYSGNDSTHNIATEMIYANYLKNGVKKTFCTNASCQGEVIEEVIDSLFTFVGYSSNDKGEMCVTYRINTDAIEAYKSFYGEAMSFSYGIVAAANNDKPLDVTEKVINVDLSENKYTQIDFKLSGLSEATKDVPITMNIYVIEVKGESTSVKYVTSSNTSDTAEAITYAASPKK